MKAADQGYLNGLLDAQRLANAHGAGLLALGDPDAAKALFALSTDLMGLRKQTEERIAHEAARAAQDA